MAQLVASLSKKTDDAHSGEGGVPPGSGQQTVRPSLHSSRFGAGWSAIPSSRPTPITMCTPANPHFAQCFGYLFTPGSGPFEKGFLDFLVAKDL